MTFKIHLVYAFVNDKLVITKFTIGTIDLNSLKFVWKHDIRHRGYATCFYRKTSTEIKKTYYFKDDFDKEKSNSYNWLSKLTHNYRRELKIYKLLETAS